MKLEELGVIGNCQFSALVHDSGEIVWCCLPRFDSEPLFSTLLDRDDGGHFRRKAALWCGFADHHQLVGFPHGRENRLLVER